MVAAVASEMIRAVSLRVDEFDVAAERVTELLEGIEALEIELVLVGSSTRVGQVDTFRSDTLGASVVC